MWIYISYFVDDYIIFIDNQISTLYASDFDAIIKFLLYFAGPMKCRKKKGHEGKAYLVLYACSLTRGIYLELLSSLETSEFL